MTREDTQLFFGIIALFVGIIGAIGICAITVYALFDPPSCRNRGLIMEVPTYWSFSTGCMVRIGAEQQYLPWSDVAPVERDGKIVFVPKPRASIKVEN